MSVVILIVVQCFGHLGIDWLMLFGGLFGAVSAVLYMILLLNTVVRVEVRKTVAQEHNKSFKPQPSGSSDAGDAGAA